MLAAIQIGSQFFSSGGAGAGVFAANNLTGISKIISMFLRGAFALAGLILLFYFIMGGIALIGSAGKDNPKSIEQAKATLTSAVTGFIVVFTAYWIVKLIGTLFGITNLI
jgi:hypothetical protein